MSKEKTKQEVKKADEKKQKPLFDLNKLFFPILELIKLILI